MKWIALAAVLTMLALAADVDVLRVDSVAPEQILHKETPPTPPDAVDQHVSGVVKLRVLVGADGKVQQVRLISGHPLLAPAAMQAVRRWVFKPFLANGKPARAIAQIEIPFAPAH